MFVELCQSSGSVLGHACLSGAHNPWERQTCIERAPKSGIYHSKGTGASQESHLLSLESSFVPSFLPSSNVYWIPTMCQPSQHFFLRPTFFPKYYILKKKKVGEVFLPVQWTLWNTGKIKSKQANTEAKVGKGGNGDKLLQSPHYLWSHWSHNNLMGGVWVHFIHRKLRHREVKELALRAQLINWGADLETPNLVTLGPVFFLA